MDSTITLLTILVSAFLALFVHFQFAPILNLRLSHHWEGTTKNFLIIRIEIENKSKVLFYNHLALLQILEYNPNDNKPLSEWLPFKESEIKKNEEPVVWNKPIKIMQNGSKIFPGEVVIIERAFPIVKNNILMHVGFQMHMKLGLFTRLATFHSRNWRQTTTIFAYK